VKVIGYRKTCPGKGKTRDKNIKKFEKKHPCDNGTISRKRRITELEDLTTECSGGQVRSVGPAIDTNLEPSERSSCPEQSLKEPNIFDPDAFIKYCDVVKRCSDAASSSTNHDVALEALTMIPKMKSLMASPVKFEVDFEEAAKDCGNIFLWWIDNQAAGTRAFIPSYKDREVCANARVVYSCATKEASQIPLEYCDEFGDEEGTHMYNALVELIREQEKKCLLFVNMCPRAWMKRLSEDVDLFANLDILDFEQWALD